MHRRAGIENELVSRTDQRVLRWFWHVKRMDEYRMARRTLLAEVSVGRVRDRQRLKWCEGGLKQERQERLKMSERQERGT